MNLKDQQYMVAIAESGSILSAAKKLNVSQPTLSRWLSKTEDEVGVQLIIRSSHQLVLTNAGRIYLEGCRKCLNTAVRMRSQINLLEHSASERIILSGSPFRWSSTFARIYPAFHRQYPDIQLDFVFEGVTPLVIKAITEGKVSMAFLGANATSTPEIEYMKFIDEELVMMIPPDHPLSYPMGDQTDFHHLPSINLSLLRDTPLLANNSGTSYGEDILRMYRNAGLESNIIFTSDVVYLLYEMVVSGAGAAILSRFYHRPGDRVSMYSLNPRIIVYQGIALQRGHHLSEAEEYLIRLIMKNTDCASYLHSYADYYLEQRKERLLKDEYEHI